MLKLKNSLLIFLFLFLIPATLLAGGTVTIQNKSGEPLEVFYKSTSNIESESGGPIIPEDGTYKIVGPKASEYLFSIGTLDRSSSITFKVACKDMYPQYCHHYALENDSDFSFPGKPRLIWRLTKTIKQNNGLYGTPHDFEAVISKSP